MGRTPGKKSRTGREVFERMMNEKPPTARITKTGQKLFKDPTDGKWRDISEADMGHIKGAVEWWNTEGRLYGAKSKEVRKWMLDSNNYVLEFFRNNRSKGSIVGQTKGYLPPVK